MIPIMNTEERAEAVRVAKSEHSPIAAEILEELQETLLGQTISRIEYKGTRSSGVSLLITTLTGTKLQVALDFDERVFGGIVLHKAGSDS